MEESDLQQEHNRMRWASRRGLLELDLLLSPFVEERFLSISNRERALFRRLVEEQDQDIMQWLMGYQPAPDAELAEMVALIRAHNDAKLKS
jgi:antitoxin CptB